MSITHCFNHSKLAHAILLSIAVALCGCAREHREKPVDVVSNNARTGAVSGEVITAKADEQYPLEAGVTFEQPVPLPENPMPTYPSKLLAQGLPPVDIQARVIVAIDGTVSRVDPISSVSARDRPFFESVRKTALQWHFLPLIRIEPGNEKSSITVNGFTTLYSGKATRLPFHLDYAFTFSQIDGKPLVEPTP